MGPLGALTCKTTSGTTYMSGVSNLNAVLWRGRSFPLALLLLVSSPVPLWWGVTKPVTNEWADLHPSANGESQTMTSVDSVHRAASAQPALGLQLGMFTSVVGEVVSSCKWGGVLLQVRRWCPSAVSGDVLLCCEWRGARLVGVRCCPSFRQDLRIAPSFYLTTRIVTCLTWRVRDCKTWRPPLDASSYCPADQRWRRDGDFL